MAEWYIKTITCRNGIEEKIKFVIPGSGGKRDRERAARREAKRADAAEHVVARALNENFDEGDIHLVLELDRAGLEAVDRRAEKYPNRTRADRRLRALQQETVNYMRRVKRLAGPGKYLFFVSDRKRDRRTGRLVACRPHVHVILPAGAEQAAREKWGLGAVLGKELYTVRGDFHALAEYLLQQTRPVEGMKRYTPSRNLDKPVETKPLLVHFGGESPMRCPRGCVEIYRSQYARGRNQYLRYLRPPQDRERKGKSVPA